MLNAHNISVHFGGDVLFDDLSFRLGAGDRVGLIGKNGAGKSTLLQLLAHKQQPTSGTFAIEKNCSIGYLPQDLDFEHGRTVVEEAYTAFDEIQALEKRMETIHQLIAETQDYEAPAYIKILDELSTLNTQYEMLGGYNYQAQTEKILKGLGFLPDQFHQQTNTFSGGWRMRIELAKLLLQRHQILLLDEPTNHLDIEAIIWLEQFLKKYHGAVVVVSHDKMFLDQVTNRTIEIIQQRLFDFKKPYSKYMKLRAELREQQAAAQKNQEKQIAQTEKLIEKFRAKASKASMAQSLIKKLEKIERIEIDPEENQVMKLSFPVALQPGKVILEAIGISKQYGANKVLTDISLHINRGEKIAFVGQNGQGKSTLAKILVQEIQFKGKLNLGHNVQIGYFAQNQSATLDPNRTLIETVQNAATPENAPRVRDLLGAFLFQGDAVEKKVKVLSGGERNRLALCALLLQPFNVLIMDEPTNHLDIASKQILKKALAKFEGTLVLVSHDRDFLEGLCEKVIEFKNEKIKPFLGGIETFLTDRAMDSLQQLEKKKKSKVKVTEGTGAQHYAQQKQDRALQKKGAQLEKKIAHLEKEIKKMDVALAINYDETVADPRFFDHYHAQKSTLDELMQAWEKVQLEIDSN
ncbi:MAG: ABC-F family ATP-binding cassette domain-containing protein [Flavobacteriaceae bacterium]